MKLAPLLVVFSAALSASALSGQTLEVTSTGAAIGTSSPNLYGASNGTFLTISGTGANSASDGRLELANPRSAITAGDSIGDIVFTAPTNTGGEKRSGGFFSSLEGSGGTDGYGGLLQLFAKADNGTTLYRAVLNSAGNFGIGTTTPEANLDIVGPASEYGGNTALLRMKGGHGGGTAYGGIRFVMFERTTGWGSDIQGFDDTAFYGGALRFRTGGGSATSTPTERMRITSAGNVGIGTGSPDYKLEVAGSVRASSFVADVNTYSDFVFKRDYRLAPLAEVEKTIDLEGHLPGIPSEAEAKAHGLDLANQQAKLLQKVEELTLYAIEQNKRLDAQAVAIEGLRQENRALRPAAERR